MTAKATAQQIRTELKTAFPAQRFSITTHRGSEFDAIYVTWIAGPTRSIVEPIASAYTSDNTFVFFDHIASA